MVAIRVELLRQGIGGIDIAITHAHAGTFNRQPARGFRANPGGPATNQDILTG